VKHAVAPSFLEGPGKVTDSAEGEELQRQPLLPGADEATTVIMLECLPAEAA
jgi:hypothetical protein